jgi:hypothetical protein
LKQYRESVTNMKKEKGLNVVDRVILYVKQSRLLYTIYSKVKMEGFFVEPDTDICIEGFPRSGNTFLCKLVKELNPDLKTANHKHSVGHIKHAFYLNKPVVILIRDPLDAITSELIRYSGDGKKISKHLYTINRYIQFYDYVSKVSNQVILVTFAELTQDTERVLYELERKYALWEAHVDYGRVAQEVLNKMKSKINEDNLYVNSAPTELRDKIKIEVKDNLKKMYPRELRQAYSVYYRVLEKFDQVNIDDAKNTLYPTLTEYVFLES